MLILKIRQKSTGLYSTGGSEPDFTPNGKAWSGRGPLKSHLRYFFDTRYRYKPTSKGLYGGVPFHDIEIVEMDLIPKTTKGLAFFVADYFGPGEITDEMKASMNGIERAIIRKEG